MPQTLHCSTCILLAIVRLLMHGARQRVGRWGVCTRGPLPKVPVCPADTLKLNFPAAWTASVLAWGYLEFQDVSLACRTSRLYRCLTWSVGELVAVGVHIVFARPGQAAPLQGEAHIPVHAAQRQLQCCGSNPAKHGSASCTTGFCRAGAVCIAASTSCVTPNPTDVNFCASLSQGYASAAQTTYIQDSLRWIADYFVLCHYADLTFTGQVSFRRTRRTQRGVT